MALLARVWGAPSICLQRDASKLSYPLLSLWDRWMHVSADVGPVVPGSDLWLSYSVAQRQRGRSFVAKGNGLVRAEGDPRYST